MAAPPIARTALRSWAESNDIEVRTPVEGTPGLEPRVARLEDLEAARAIRDEEVLKTLREMNESMKVVQSRLSIKQLAVGAAGAGTGIGVVVELLGQLIHLLQ